MRPRPVHGNQTQHVSLKPFYLDDRECVDVIAKGIDSQIVIAIIVAISAPSQSEKGTVDGPQPTRAHRHTDSITKLNFIHHISDA